MAFPQDKIRNFSIIAHIDHGKSTLADRILEHTNSVSARDMEAQLLDDMELERERGITIKARAVSVIYSADNGEQYLFNLIDTPGHVDFNYEVSRSLAACEGAILVVDASQGIEAQTLANTYLAVDSGLEIVPVINKIDLPSADPDRVISEIEDVIGIPAEDAPKISAKAGINIHAVLEKIVSDIPAPTGDVNAPLRALIFDSYYDSYKGVIIYVRLKEGQIHPGDTFKLMATGSTFNVVECGLMHATQMEKTDGLYAGEVGYIAGSIKTLADAKVGDTVTLADNPAAEPLPGYREAQPMVFCGIYPVDGAKYGDLKDALEKLQLNDAALSFEPETSVALGFGFRCGSLRLSRSAAYGDHSGASGEGVSARFDHHRAERYLQDTPHRRHGREHRQPDQLSRPFADPNGGGAGDGRAHLFSQGVCRQYHGAVSGQARHLCGHAVYRRGQGGLAL